MTMKMFIVLASSIRSWVSASSHRTASQPASLARQVGKY
jgi:hypothetical protein